MAGLDDLRAFMLRNRAPIPVVANAGLRNVPDKGIYAWDPGAQLGVHRMDEFFLTEQAQ